jgi:hypothetical protein
MKVYEVTCSIAGYSYTTSSNVLAKNALEAADKYMAEFKKRSNLEVAVESIKFVAKVEIL